jgi:glyoxylase-like metal-dependent hydrolase (beta-lactamase superfamily II)
VQRPEPDDSRQTLPSDDAPEQLEPGLWRIPLPLPFALRSANVYLIDGGDGSWALVDAGLGLPADEAALRAGLAAAGVRLEDLGALVLTHAHPDHIGLAGPVVAASGAPVYLLRGEDGRMYSIWAPFAHDSMATVQAMYAANGLPPDEVESSRRDTERLLGILRLPPPGTLRLLEDGQTLHFGAHTYAVIWTPGHSDYHMCLLREDGLFIAGDHILPGITPNIGWYPNVRPDPLGDYYAALAKVRDLPVRLVLPGHRRPFTDLAGRVDELSAHHRDRSARIVALLRDHPEGLNAAQVAQALFGDRLTNGADRRFAVVEMLAHLEHLRLAGQTRRVERDGLIFYRLVAGAQTGADLAGSGVSAPRVAE